METIYRDEQVAQISKRLNISKLCVTEVIKEYVSYLRNKLDAGDTVKFLNVCYLRRKDGDESNLHETLAYTASELSKSLSLSPVVVGRILQEYEETLIKDLRKLNSYSIRGIIRIKLEKNYRGEFKVRTKKSTVYNGTDVYVTTIGKFKRRAEVLE